MNPQDSRALGSNPATTTQRAGEEHPYGWVMVGLAMLFLGVGNGGVQAVAVFLKPISADFGWLRSQTVFSYTAATLAMGVGGILMGYLSDRFTTRRIAQVGTVAMAAGFLALSQLANLWQFYVLYAVMGGFGASALFAPILANVGAWFTRRKGLAVGLATAGQALGQGGVPYIAALLIDGLGWRMAYTALGAGSVALLLPLTFLIRQPNAPQAAPGRPVAGAASASTVVPPVPSLALLGAAAVFCCITMATPLVHVVALASDAGLTAEGSARVLLILMLTGVLGRVMFGRLADQIGALPTYMVAALWQTATVYWFTQAGSPATFYLLAALFGYGFAGVMTCLILCAQNFSPPARAGVSTGIIVFFGWIGMGVGGLQAGYFYDLSGNYGQAFINATLAGVVNLSILVTLFLYRMRHLRGPTAPAVAA